MQYFYDKTQKTFLIDNIHTIPEGAIPVDNRLYSELIQGRAEGKDIIVKRNQLSLTSTAKPSPYHEWDGKKWIISPEQQAVKKVEEIAMVRERINALRDSKSAGGVYVEQLGKWFDSDDKAQKKLLGLKATMDLVGEMTVSWTCADNTDFEGFGKAHLTAVIAAILQAENHNHTVARQHKANLEQADNPLKYDYSAGWAKTYEDFLNEQTEKLSLS
ncbi:TPA: DUF4376 domain-containing protein [Mannheimia haemolytica]